MRHPLTPQGAFSGDKIASTHDTALRILGTLGIRLRAARTVRQRAVARLAPDPQKMIPVNDDPCNAMLSAMHSHIRG